MAKENNTVAEETHRLPGIARLYCDTRLGGMPRYSLTDKPECLMQVPEEVRKCVVFLGYRNADGIHELAGTAFFLTRIIGMDKPAFLPEIGRGFSYLVTAKHVIDGIRNKNTDRVCVRVNDINGKARWVDTNIGDWIYHPDESDSVDAAVYRASIPNDLDHMSAALTSAATEEIIRETGISTGDEVFLVGLFAQHHGTHRNIPIVRVGNIAAMPEEPVEVRQFDMMEAYLIEARSLGGISGSPVFVHIPADRAAGMLKAYTTRPSGTVFFLLGLMHGHWDTMLTEEDAVLQDARNVQRVNMGIAIVVPATKILEVIGQPMIRKDEDEIIRRENEAKLPTTDSLKPEQTITREGFEDALKRASRKASSPDEGRS